MKIGFLASHGGTAARHIIAAIRRDQLVSTVGPLITNNSESKIYEWCGENEVVVHHISNSTHPDDAARDKAILKILIDEEVDLVVLSGFMKKIGPDTLNRYQNRILNIHPSLLPKYGGKGMFGDHVHESVLASDDKISGASVQLINAEYDEGPILAQHEIDIKPEETIESLRIRINSLEGPLYLKVIQQLELNEIWLDK